MFRPFWITAVVFTGLTMLHTQLVFSEDDITKSELPLPAMNAEILSMQDQGYSPKKIDVKSDGKEPKFTIVFSQSTPVRRVVLAAPRQQIDREIVEALRHGGIQLLQLKGYRVGKDPYFALVAAEVAPPRTGGLFKAFLDVPSPALQGLVEQERRRGGRLVDQSYYKGPDDRDYNTALFHPR